MYGWLIGKNNNKVLLVKIKINNNKSFCNTIIDKQNATYYTNEFIIIDIIDEFKNDYISVDIKTIIDDKFSEIKNLKINELYNNGLFFYINKERALQDIYLITNKTSGVFNQYLHDGTFLGKIKFFNGKLITT